MDVYLPIAEMSVSVELVLALGVVVGFLSGVFGVGGGFLATPFLMFMGVPPAIAVGTQAAQLVASSLSGTLYYLRKGNVDRDMGHSMLMGAILGSILGIGIFALIKSLGHIDVVVPLLYVLLLSFIGFTMMWETISHYLIRQNVPKQMPRPSAFFAFLNGLPCRRYYKRSGITISALIPAFIGFVGGLLVSIMGIGGGFVTVPLMLYLLAMPSLLVVGTSLYQIVFTAAFATLMHALSNHTVDIVLASLLIISSVLGAQIGARAAQYLKGTVARFALAILVLIVATKIGFDLFIAPENIYSLVVE